MCPSAFRVSSPRGSGGEWVGVKPGPKPSLDRWGCVYKISPRLVQWFGLPLALHIPTEKTNKHHFYMYRLMIRQITMQIQEIFYCYSLTQPNLLGPCPEGLFQPSPAL